MGIFEASLRHTMEPKRKPNREVYVPPARRSLLLSGVNDCTDYGSSTLGTPTDNSICRPSISSKDIDEVHNSLASLSISKSDEASSRSNAVTEKTLVKNNLNSNKSTPNSSLPNNRTEPSINYDDFRHVIELYGFSKELQTLHLQSELRGFEDGGFHIKWVDDTHALAVFSSISDANRALAQVSGLFLKARPLKDASLSSKWKLANSPGDWAMPYKKRPPTTSSTARRLISNHLGLPAFKQKTAEQIQREKEDKEALREARARANAIKQAQQSIWDD